MSLQTTGNAPADLNAFVGDYFPDRSLPSDGLIVQSWYRSVVEHGLEPAGRGNKVILSAAEIHRHQEFHHDYMTIAGQGVSGLAKRVGQAGFAVLLSDEHGIALDSRVPTTGSAYTDSGLIVGSRWDESLVGTNGIGTGLASGSALIIHRDEHFLRENDRLSCSVSPIFDSLGNVRGCLNASCLNSNGPKEAQYLTLQLVIMYARMIENAYFRHSHRNTLTLMIKPCEEISDLANEQLLALDDQGRVIGANRAAFVEHQTHGHGLLLGRRLDDLLPVDVDELLRLCNGGANATRLRAGQRLVEVGLRMPVKVRSPRQPEPQPAAIIHRAPTLERLAGADARLQQSVARLHKVLDKDLPILINGETGTGKEAFARAIHLASGRRAGPFVALNCAAIPETLIESELFGYRSGSFTGASKKGMKGKLEIANGGTLFLDEIGDMPAHLQTRLLRVLAEREISPLGADTPLPLDIQVISATHQNLTQMVAGKRFREDLFYRLNGMTLQLPALRERSDIRLLIESVLRDQPGGEKCRIDATCMKRLSRYAWPGNIRQLINVLRYAVALAEDGWIDAECLPAEVLDQGPQDQALPSAVESRPPLAQLTADDEGQRLLEALRRHQWNITGVADEFAVARSTLYRKMKKYRIVQPNRVG
ncbi:sigma-54-dependent Fis family transcriptional regulator [Pseudomonas sp. Bc-h]|jgi:transcriptional regulator of acetoin/glycerol metabolism|uniref:sigma-54-dependent Fis family transcriptional regulator n=1 Tax=Pseudomonas sp. Bc-h TaxID=1943632 RepID=UPI0009DB4959|nr:sigma-54-dependent Fis family transcriptional regulator [Pseudomonas sp. Bc-h]OQR31569.1 sigma-54-dependent Fis family transcriptional regulator [Pseudomonas sp. Bc-h]